MEFGNINIGRDGIYNLQKRANRIAIAEAVGKFEVNELHKKKSKKAYSKIKKQTLQRIRASVKRWLNARDLAESEINPTNTELVRIYKDIEVDAHLWALMQTIRLKVMANKFSLYVKGSGKEGKDEIDQEATEMFQKKWFRNVIRYTVDSEFYGFSLVQLGDIVHGCFKEAELVPREYVVQQKEGIQRSLGNSKDLIPYGVGLYKNWTLPIGEKRNLGLLAKAAPLVIKKKEVISAWSEAAELFGMPLRIGKTDIQNDDARKNMEDMMENMGEAAWAVIGDEDSVELVTTSKTDISNMYDKFVERVNSELSKLILSQTGTTDEKAHVGAAKVHENVLKDVIESFILMVEDVSNEMLIPLCQRHGILGEGIYLKADNEQKFTPKELFDIVKELLTHFDISEDWINETFEVPVEKKETPEPIDPELKPIIDPNAKADSVMKAVSKLYEGVLECC